MPAKTRIYVNPHPKGWALQVKGADRPRKVYDRKDDAVADGRALARKQKPSQLVIKKTNGRIQSEHSYDV